MLQPDISPTHQQTWHHDLKKLREMLALTQSVQDALRLPVHPRHLPRQITRLHQYLISFDPACPDVFLILDRYSDILGDRIEIVRRKQQRDRMLARRAATVTAQTGRP